MSASPQYLAFEIAGEAVCGSVGAAEYLRVARLSDFKDRWVFTQDIRALSPDVVWGPKAIDVFRSAAKAACRDYARSPLARGPETQIPGMLECSDELVGDGFSDWAVRIGSNALAVAGRIQAWRMNYLDFTVPLVVPPAYELAHVPPSQRRVLGQTLRLSVARDEAVVYLEWAAGESARRWSQWATDTSVSGGLGR